MMNLIGYDSYLMSKAKSIVSSLSGLILWSTASPLSPPALRNPKSLSSLQRNHILGLKTLIHAEPQTTHYLHRAGVSKPSPPPPPASSLSQVYARQYSATMDDLIGTDSGVHMVPTSAFDDQTTAGDEYQRRDRSNSRVRDKRRQHEALERYPPPIPSAAKGNLRRRARWAWTRHHHDGRLVIEAREVERNEYLEARREDGRLIVNLISVGVNDHDHRDDDEDFHGLFGGEEIEMNCDRDDRGLCLEASSSGSNSCAVFMDSVLSCNNVPSLPALLRPMSVTSVIT